MLLTNCCRLAVMLQDLHISNAYLAGVPDSQLQLFTGLTASTQLTAMHIFVHGMNDLSEYVAVPPIPMGALHYIFPQGKQWPLLQTLKLEVSAAPDKGFAEICWCVDASDIRQLAIALLLEVLLLRHVVVDDRAAAVAALAQHMTLASSS
jgi:hypothetical protein